MSFLNRCWAACLFFVVGCASSRGVIEVGDKFPSLESGTLVGGYLPVATGKITLIDFWASWCAPCKMSFPVYAKLYASCQSRGLVIVAISADENQAAFEDFIKRTAPPFSAVRDTDHRLASQVQVPAMPTCYLLSRDGRVRFIHQGFHGAATENEIRQEIDSLLAEPPSKP